MYVLIIEKKPLDMLDSDNDLSQEERQETLNKNKIRSFVFGKYEPKYYAKI